MFSPLCPLSKQSTLLSFPKLSDLLSIRHVPKPITYGIIFCPDLSTSDFPWTSSLTCIQRLSTLRAITVFNRAYSPSSVRDGGTCQISNPMNGVTAPPASSKATFPQEENIVRNLPACLHNRRALTSYLLTRFMNNK